MAGSRVSTNPSLPSSAIAPSLTEGNLPSLQQFDFVARRPNPKELYGPPIPTPSQLIKVDRADIPERVRPLAREALTHTPSISQIYGFGYRAGVNDHDDGYALDLMVPERSRDGYILAGYLVANHRRLGIQYLIWDGRIWNAACPTAGPNKDGWRPMTLTGDKTADHRDHIHITLRRPDKEGERNNRCSK